MMPCPIPIDPGWFPEEVRPALGTVLSARWSRDERKVLRRKKPMRPSEWAEKNIVLPSDSPVPGPYRCSMVPYAAGVMDASFFPGVEEIVMCWPSQTSKTTIVNNCLAYAADRAPGNAIVTYPDEVTSKDNSKDRLLAMINASPLLRTFKTNKTDDEGAVKIKLRHMIIYMAWANSAARLANRPAPYGVADEEDKFPVTVGKKESGPVDLLRNRARNFAHMRKLWRVSTPTIETGPIWRALTEECELVFVYYVRCPHCSATQLMVMGDGKEGRGIKWSGGSKADPKEVHTRKLAYYECEKCHESWSDSARNMAVRMGQWRDRDTGMALEACLKSVKPRVIGFHLPAWVSPFVSLSECAAAFLLGLNDLTKLKKYKNDYEAKPWIIRTHERKVDAIFELCDERPEGMVPGGNRVSCLTAGIDTQDYSFWYEIRAWGWGTSMDSWQIRAGEVLTFNDLEEILWNSEYRDPDGNLYFVRLALQDAMGHRTADVYDFCRRHGPMIFATQGKDTLAQPFAWSSIDFYPGGKKPIPGGLKLIRFDTNFFKNELSRRLGVNLGDPGAWRFHTELTDAWAAHMSAEFIGESGKWECPEGKDNHGWDCSVLNRLAGEVLGVKYWPQPGESEIKHSEVSDRPGGDKTYKPKMW